MGVHGLWPLLEPVGRRINIEAITNKRLAVGKGLHAMLGAALAILANHAVHACAHMHASLTCAVRAALLHSHPRARPRPATAAPAGGRDGGGGYASGVNAYCVA